MQNIVQVICKKGPSLRDKMANDMAKDKNARKFQLDLIQGKNMDRKRGWAVYKSRRDDHGSLKCEWHAPSTTLICRFVTKKRNRAPFFIGDLVSYILCKHHKRVLAIVVREQ